ncbi:MAG: UDP-N-acetylmuramoyl-L-alanyl-D-glutamate--2,6-diaminopimelate ligase [Acidiferrobacteraceae bacterium]|nr:UDP-N-acetylmuramoyl-L-alanyl-D-glutamate--2,6-diaminopimelate ligase [Acidiferrobacteraceae bacterium]
MMKRLQIVESLNRLLDGIVTAPVPEGICITGLSLDSRAIEHGNLFLGLPGIQSDGRSFVRQAITSGASAVLLEGNDSANQEFEVPCYRVSNLREHVGLIASRFYGSPSRFLCIVGFTGTNGKTTCAALATQALARMGHDCGMIGTLGMGRWGDLESTDLTTPDAVALQAGLAQMVESGIDTVCMEVSSHALDQSRVKALDFDAAVLTNISRDHIDYHGSLESYAATKFLLFQEHSVQAAVINVADPYGFDLVNSSTSENIWTYGYDNTASVYIKKTEISSSSIRLWLETSDGPLYIEAPLLGRINAINLVAVVTVLLALDHKIAEIEDAMSCIEPIPGRMEIVSSVDSPVRVVIDYAHTPNALEQSLFSLREHTSQHLWCVFGCGGNRDKGKRAIMGSVSDRLADKIVLTNDNPRDEDPNQILSDIEVGIRHHDVVKIPERQAAISYAISHAGSGDIVLVAGKGHETQQIVGSDYIPLCDRTIAINCLEAMH